MLNGQVRSNFAKKVGGGGAKIEFYKVPYRNDWTNLSVKVRSVQYCQIAQLLEHLTRDSVGPGSNFCLVLH